MRRVLDASRDWITLVDCDGSILLMNARGLALTGEGADRGAWRTLWSLEDRGAVDAALAAAAAGDTGRFVAARVSREDNGGTWQVEVTAVEEAAGPPTRLLCVARPADPPVQGDHEPWRLDVELAAGGLAANVIGFWRWDMVTNTVRASGGLAPAYGVDPGEAMNDIPVEVWLARVHPEDRAGIFAQLAEKNRVGEEEIALEYRLVQADGSERWLFAKARLIRETPGGPVVGARGLTIDTTQAHEAERRLKQADDQLSLALETAGVMALWELDLVTNIMRAGEAFVDAYGVDPALAVKGGPVEAFLANVIREDAKSIPEILALLESGVDEITDEYRVRRPDGVERWFMYRARAVRDADGNAVRLRGVTIDTTDRKRADKSRGELEERLAFAKSASGIVGLWDWDVATNLIFSDASFAESMGVDPAQAARGAPAHWFFRRMHPDDRQANWHGLTRLADGRQEAWIESRFLAEDGSVRWLLARGKVEYDARGLVMRVRGATVDVTELKQSELARATSEKRLSLTLAAAGMVGVWEWDLGAGMFYADAPVALLCGVDPDAAARGAPAEAWVRNVHPEDRSITEAEIERLAQGGEGFATELRVLQADGSVRWLRSRGQAERDEDGTLLRISGSTVDATERRLAEAAQAATEARLSLALNATDTIAVWEWDITADKLYAEGPLATLLQLDIDVARRGAPLGALWDRIDPADMPGADAAAARVLAGADDFAVEFRVAGLDGKPRWIMARGRAERGEDGVPRCVRGAAVDITDRKQFEERQRLLMRELDHRVKNTFAMVEVIVGQALRTGRELPEIREIVSSRLLALSQAHEVLVRGQWNRASLKTLVEAVARVHGHGDTSRFVVAGPDVSLAPDAALSFALALHELGTNSAKYGALSKAGGRADVAWRVDAEAPGARLWFRWRETGGPVVAPPTRRGFGGALIERCFAQLEAEVRFDYPPTGMLLTLNAPLTALRPRE